MIKDRTKLINILRIDENTQDTEIESIAKCVRDNLKSVVDIASEQRTKDLAQNKIRLIDSCYEYSGVECEQKDINEKYSLSENTVCRLTREKLFGTAAIHVSDIDKMLATLNVFHSAEAKYLKGLLELKKTKGREDNFDHALGYLKEAAEQEPNNQNYRVVYDTVLNMREKYLNVRETQARNEKEKADAELRRHEMEEREEMARDRAETVKNVIGGIALFGLAIFVCVETVDCCQECPKACCC